MPRPDIEPNGALERTVKPTLDRLYLNAEMGLNTVLSPDAARATADALTNLTREIDRRDALRWMDRAMLKAVGAVIFVLIALWAAA